MVQEMAFKDMFYLVLWQPFVRPSRTICAILEEGVIRNNFFEIIFNLDQWFRRKDISYLELWIRNFLSRAMTAHLLGGAEPFVQFW